MASPMRKKRAWSTPDQDADSQESAAFEARVAAAKDAAAKSGAFLSSAKEDLTDHQRWLRAQSAAVERDRQRHEKWLQRQRDQEQAALRRQRVRRRRRLMRQRAVQSVRQAIVDLLLFVRSWIVFVVNRVVGGFKAAVLSVGRGLASLGRGIAHGFAIAGRTIANGFTSLGRGIARGTAVVVRTIAQGFALGRRMIAQGLAWMAAKLSMAARKGGKGLATGAAWSTAKLNASARAGGTALAAGSLATAKEVGKLSRFAGRSVSKGLSTMQSKGARLGSAAGRFAAGSSAIVVATSSKTLAAVKRGFGGLYHWTASRLAPLPPALYEQVARLGQNVQRFAQTRAPGAQSRASAASGVPPALAEVAEALEVSEDSRRQASAELSGEVASVHVIEVYGPHLYGVSLFGRPANEPWTPEPVTTEPALAEARLTEAKPEHQAVDSLGHGPLVEVPVAAPATDHQGEGPVTAGPRGSPAVLEGLAAWWRSTRVRAASLSVSTVAAANEALAWIGARAARAWNAGREASGRALSWTKTSVRDLTAAFADQEALAKTKAQAQNWSREAWARALNRTHAIQAFARTQIGTRAQNWAATRGFDLSQMMVIAGTVLLVCGGLLIGGGLLMRAGARAPVTAAVPDETFSGITWTFNEPGLPLPDRAVFTLSGTPQSFLINGLSISGVNNSDQALTALEGFLRPDVQRPDLRLALEVDAPQSQSSEEASIGAAQEPATLPDDAVPAHTSFRLVFPFPPEAMDGADGISVEDFFDSYGGLFLTLRYEIDGVEKSVFQYLAPDMLKAQLHEVSLVDGGS